ncbi:hypothetical protein pipiens_015461, partial [Culex pipiens pipiens]
MVTTLIANVALAEENADPVPYFVDIFIVVAVDCFASEITRRLDDHDRRSPKADLSVRSFATGTISKPRSHIFPYRARAPARFNCNTIKYSQCTLVQRRTRRHSPYITQIEITVDSKDGSNHKPSGRKKQTKMAPSQKSTKKWEIFAGRNKFYCDGYLMTAPNSGVFYFTVVLITGTSGLFFAFDCPFLAERITPAIPIVGGILFVFTMSSLFRTSFSDPGIIPRASQDEAAYIEKQIEVPNSLNSPTYRPPPRTKEVFVKGQTVKLKYCFTCKIFRPPRASHCSLCDNCVDRFDHHCPWVGNCVGKRNYRFFYMFIVSLAFLAVFIFSCTTTHIVLLFKDEDQFFDIVKKTPFSVIIAVICFCSVWSVIGLAGFHTYLTTSDQTTNEDIKGSFTSKGGQQAINPYSQGNICLNCFHILCGPITPSLIDRRGVVTDEYRTQMQPPDKYNSAPVPPLVVMQPGHDTLNKPYSLE